MLDDATKLLVQFEKKIKRMNGQKVLPASYLASVSG